MFTILPVRVSDPVDADLASRAVRWLPAVGALLAAPAAALMLAVGPGTGVGGAGGDASLRRLLGAVLAVAVLGVLTGGLHLDGLADTADGLASRREAPAALDIMRRGDTGPLGVAALVFAVLLQVAALAVVPWRLAAPGLVLGAVTARVAVILATGPGFPAARPGGFGALVAGRTPARVCVAAVALLLAAVAAFGFLAGGAGLFGGAGLAGGGVLGAGGVLGGGALTARLLTAVVAGLLAATGLCVTARGRLGGLTGDVFGAVVEVTMTVTLVALAALT